MIKCKEVTFRDIAVELSDGLHAAPKFFPEGEYIFVNAKNIVNGRIVDVDPNKKTSYEEYLKYKIDLDKNTILYSIDGTIGNVAKYRGEKVVLGKGACYIKLKPEVDSDYIFFYLQSPQFSEYIRQMSTGSTIRHISLKTMRNHKFCIPDILIQKRIACILSSLQNKIDNNNLINENLEQQALALFRHYFMDYQPYGGSAPSGWSEVSLDDVCTRITDGSHYSPADAPDAPYPMYSVKDMETYGFNSSSCKHITEEEFHKMQKNDCVPKLNDILVAKDGSYLKEIFICSEEKDEAILSSIAIFRPNTEIIMPEILLYLLTQPSVRKDVGDNYVSGSALPRIVLKDFKKYTFLLPPMADQSKIGSFLHAIRMQTKASIDEIQRLSSLRDSLLPRLMSGELDVSELDL